jgi:hypothetical protein
MTKDERLGRGRIWRIAVVGLALLLAAAALAGCLTEAEDKDFKFDNPNDNTPASGSSDTGSMSVAFVDEQSDVVLIANQTGEDQDMANWLVINANGEAAYTFGEFTLSAGAIVRLHRDPGTDDGDDLYEAGVDWNSTAPDDEVDLQDGEGNFVDSCSRGDTCWPF